jgi:DNA-binding GntR family transcriptional regulator
MRETVSTVPGADSEDPRRGARTLVEFAYEAMRQDILRGALTPGERLRVEALKDTYKVGASTLREALTLLVGEALVTAEGQRGFRVAPISLKDFEDTTRVRKLLELEALRESITNGNDDWEAEVVAAFHRLSKVEEQFKLQDRASLSGEWEERNRAFHAALISATHSRWLNHFIDILYQQSERYRRIALAGRPVNRDVHNEHLAIKEAALSRDVKEACRLSELHIDRTFVALSKMFKAQQGE